MAEARASLMGPSSGGRVSFVGNVSDGRTVTMLFTDIEGSTRLAREMGDSWPEVVREHHRLVGGAIAQHGGEVERTAGDSFFALFTDPERAVSAAAAGQRALSAHAAMSNISDGRPPGGRFASASVASAASAVASRVGCLVAFSRSR